MEKQQMEHAWDRLHQNRTLASERRTVFSVENDSSPHDSLDIALGAIYNQSQDRSRPRNLVLIQSRTCEDSERTVAIKRDSRQAHLRRRQQHPLRVVEQPEKVHPSYVRLAHDNQHSLHSRDGYSRKPNGGVFTN